TEGRPERSDPLTAGRPPASWIAAPPLVGGRIRGPDPPQVLEAKAVVTGFKESKALRTETTINDTHDFGVGRLVTEELPSPEGSGSGGQRCPDRAGARRRDLCPRCGHPATGCPAVSRERRSGSGVALWGSACGGVARQPGQLHPRGWRVHQRQPAHPRGR